MDDRQVKGTDQGIYTRGCEGCYGEGNIVGEASMAHVACPGAVEAVPANRPTCGRLRFKCEEH
jgi:hypothetical protein